MQEFVKAVIAYQKKLDSTTSVPRPLKLDQAMEKKRKGFDLVSLMIILSMQSNTALSIEQENRLKQMGATVRNAGSYIERLRMNEEREKMAENVMGKNVCRAAVRLAVFLPYDGTDLLRSF
uniref:Uncharacterized protein n=1 Tax=Salix viminalis TaxID=40686 RepID=A0A6N2NEP5_SALVM